LDHSDQLVNATLERSGVVALRPIKLAQDVLGLIGPIHLPRSSEIDELRAFFAYQRQTTRVIAASRKLPPLVLAVLLPVIPGSLVRRQHAPVTAHVGSQYIRVIRQIPGLAVDGGALGRHA